MQSDLEREFIVVFPQEIIQGFGLPPLQYCGSHAFGLSCEDTRISNMQEENHTKHKHPKNLSCRSLNIFN